jgi:hypothetical protein
MSSYLCFGDSFLYKIPTYSLIEDQKTVYTLQNIYSSWPYNVEQQGHYTENLKQILPEKELRGLNHNFHIHVSVIKLYIPTIGLFILQ